MIRLNLAYGKGGCRHRGYNEEHQRQWTDEVMLGLCFSGRFAPVTPPWENENKNNMMPRALQILGRLNAGEIYGFVPALSLGGSNTIQHFQKTPFS
ncbi:T6SS immunity protein Tdi1 domain-containing protein [Rhizobium laguerreae]|uniref:T6SS immunity protein Tdi1 domain-containing protein n=1 Tax=Rhizobium laguerreae TaxID=1076926 RepID=UPI001C90E47E|nr:T6SS immunity protein Tdi1 domain-containing protein [Rhizobium laguerreae]MBY3246395.1 DUF1851 domain-containing protein [Rhizobium laguerreae]